MTTNRLRFVTGEEDIAKRKKNLRAYMKEKRGENENRDGKETQMLENLFSKQAGLIQKGKTKKWFVYLSFSSEARTDALIEKLLVLSFSLEKIELILTAVYKIYGPVFPSKEENLSTSKT